MTEKGRRDHHGGIIRATIERKAANASPLTVAASALTGTITDLREKMT